MSDAVLMNEMGNELARVGSSCDGRHKVERMVHLRPLFVRPHACICMAVFGFRVGSAAAPRGDRRSFVIS